MRAKGRKKRSAPSFASSQSFQYLVSRTLSISMSTFMALHYSRILGPENRGILSFITLLMMVLSEIFLGAINLEIRSTHNTSLIKKRVRHFLTTSLQRILLIVLILLFFEVIFSRQKSEIKPVLFAITAVYVLIALVTQQLLELLLAFSKIRISSILEVTIVSLQIIIYTLLLTLSSISTIIIVLTSFITSYFITIIVLIIKNPSNLNAHPKLEISKDSFIKESRMFIPQVISIALLDRLDKVLFLLLFSISDFGRYMVAASLFSTFRFLPEAIGKLVLNRKLLQFTIFITQNRKLMILIAGVLIFPLATLGGLIISTILGVDWQLPISIYFLLLNCELLRFLVVVELNRRNITRDHIFPAWSPIVIAVLLSFTVLCLRPFLGITAIPIVMFIAYSFILWLLGRKLNGEPARSG